MRRWQAAGAFFFSGRAFHWVRMRRRTERTRRELFAVANALVSGRISSEVKYSKPSGSTGLKALFLLFMCACMWLKSEK